MIGEEEIHLLQGSATPRELYINHILYLLIDPFILYVNPFFTEHILRTRLILGIEKIKQPIICRETKNTVIYSSCVRALPHDK
jgi:hypothetical protein